MASFAFKLAAFAFTIALCYAQYPYQVAPDGPSRRREPVERYEPEPEPEPYQPLPPKRRSPVFNPASVHYVNIGEKLEGDYKFGYDTGKGGDGQSFREETRLPDGTVQGAYGYVDADGKQRIVRYTAGKDGFKAEGDIGPDGLPKSRAPATAPAARPVPRPAPQSSHHQAPPAYSPPPQQHQSYAPREQPSYAPREQPEYSRPQPQPSYSRPQPSPAYSAPANPRPAAPRRQYAPQPRPAPARPAYEEPDYNDYSNDLSEEPRVIVPIDTALFNYNIGTSNDRKSS